MNDEQNHARRVALWKDWHAADAVTLHQAACLLSGTDPHGAMFRDYPPSMHAISASLKQAIIVGKLKPYALFESAHAEDAGSRDVAMRADELTPHTDVSNNTTVKTSDLADWCHHNRIPNPWGDADATNQATSSDAYPEELRAAIEAFEAVHSDIAVTAKQTPKAALTAWLAKNKPGLSANARERIVTVANWRPQGGAPKTPGE